MRPRSASVTALGTVEAVAVSGDRFRGFLAARPHATSLIMRQLATRLRSADVERRALASETVLQRLAARLVELAERAGRQADTGTVLELPLPQHDLAAAVGATREAVAKALRLLREQDVVRTANRTVIILDTKVLVLSPRGAHAPAETGRTNLRRVCKRLHRRPRKAASLDTHHHGTNGTGASRGSPSEQCGSERGRERGRGRDPPVRRLRRHLRLRQPGHGR